MSAEFWSRRRALAPYGAVISEGLSETGYRVVEVPMFLTKGLSIWWTLAPGPVEWCEGEAARLAASPGSPGVRRFFDHKALGDVSVGRRRSTNCGLHESVELHARSSRAAPVEPEGELIEICRQMLGLNTTLMGRIDPAFDQRGDAVDGGQEFVGLVAHPSTT